MRGEIVDPPIKAHIERDVELADGQGGVTIAQYVSSIQKTLNPKVGDTLTQGGETFKLDVLIADNGYTVRHILVKV